MFCCRDSLSYRRARNALSSKFGGRAVNRLEHFFAESSTDATVPTNQRIPSLPRHRKMPTAWETDRRAVDGKLFRGFSFAAIWNTALSIEYQLYNQILP